MTHLARLQAALGYQFRDLQLLGLALTHCSAGGQNNERLEYLGDAVLNYIIAEALYRRFPDVSEGEMSRMRASIVKGDTLAEVALDLQLGGELRLGAGERKSGGHRRTSILADALEAVAGAILLDGDVEQCRRCVLTWFASRLQQLAPGATDKDAKTRLQEYLQGRSNPLPEYELLRIEGDDHDQLFHVACRVSKPFMVVEGRGSSRRKAEQSAATSALERLSDHGR